MNPNTNPNDLQAYLAALPELPPSSNLWPRIERTRQRRRRRKQALFGSIGLAAVIALAVWLPRPELAAEQALAEQTPLAAPLPNELRDIDRLLQAAYDRGEDHEQINALWRAREFAALRQDQEVNSNDSVIRL